MQGSQFFFTRRNVERRRFILAGDRFGFNAVMSYRKKRVEFEIEYDLCGIGPRGNRQGNQKILRSKLMGVRSEKQRADEFSHECAFVAVEGERETCRIRGVVVAVEDPRLR
jgi:hypothetical protein